MSGTGLLIQNIAELFSMSPMIGSGKTNNFQNINKQKNIFFIILFLLILLLIKGLIVYLLYNFMIPKLIYSVSGKKSIEDIENSFHPISFSESVLVVILFNVLFSS